MMLVRLTPTGHQALMAMLPVHFRQIGAIMAALSEAERKTLVGLVDKLVDQVATLPRPAAGAAAAAVAATVPA
jgi:DNA-binding MarR family transcriptional regulator